MQKIFWETLNKLIPFMVRQAHHERNQQHTVRPELVEGLVQCFLCLGLTLLCASAVAQSTGGTAVTPEQIKAGAEIYAANCATCHGNRMKNPEWAIDLATIPKDDRQRFIQSVSGGRGNMPPWGDVLKPNEIEALWAYFSTAEK